MTSAEQTKNTLEKADNVITLCRKYKELSWLQGIIKYCMPDTVTRDTPAIKHVPLSKRIFPPILMIEGLLLTFVSLLDEDYFMFIVSLTILASGIIDCFFDLDHEIEYIPVSDDENTKRKKTVLIAVETDNEEKTEALKKIEPAIAYSLIQFSSMLTYMIITDESNEKRDISLLDLEVKKSKLISLSALCKLYGYIAEGTCADVDGAVALIATEKEKSKEDELDDLRLNIELIKEENPRYYDELLHLQSHLTAIIGTQLSERFFPSANAASQPEFSMEALDTYLEDL